MNDIGNTVGSWFDTSEERRSGFIGIGAMAMLLGVSKVYSSIENLYPDDALLVTSVLGLGVLGSGFGGVYMYGKKAGQRTDHVINTPETPPQIDREEIREVVERELDGVEDVVGTGSDDVVVKSQHVENTPLTISDTRQRDGMIKAMSRSTHLLIKGMTGGGKTLMVSHIVDMCLANGDQVVVFDPDASVGKWKETEDDNIMVYGGGDDYDEIDKGFALIKVEIENRRKARKMGIRKFPKSVIVIDEAPDVLRLTENARENVEDLLRRARKLNIMLILSSQDTQVKTLAFQGSSKLLENFSYVMMMKYNKATDKRTMEIDSETFDQPMEFDTPYLEDPEAHLPVVEYQSTMMDTLNSGIVPRKPRDEFVEKEYKNDPDNPPLSLIVRQITNSNLKDSGMKIGKNIVTIGDVQAIKILNGIFGENNHRKQISVLVFGTSSRYHYGVLDEILGGKNDG